MKAGRGVSPSQAARAPRYRGTDNTTRGAEQGLGRRSRDGPGESARTTANYGGTGARAAAIKYKYNQIPFLHLT